MEVAALFTVFQFEQGTKLTHKTNVKSNIYDIKYGLLLGGF